MNAFYLSLLYSVFDAKVILGGTIDKNVAHFCRC